jgi:hypothetical protein
MRKLMLATLFLGLAGPLAASELQLARIQANPELAGHDQRMAALSPSLREWVIARSRAAVDSGVVPDPALIAEEAEQRLAGQDFGSGDIEALIQMVMMESARQADAELRETMEQMQANNKRKAEMRAGMAARREAAADARAELKDATLEMAERSPKPVTIACIRAPCNPQITPVQQPTDQTDSLSEMGETDSLRLQLAMDRRSKFMEALSNLMKKSSDTAETITSNLK